MTRPIFDPSTAREIAKSGWDVSQLQRRPAPIQTPAGSGCPAPCNDNFFDAIGLLPDYSFSGMDFVYNWEGSVDGTNVAATLDGITDPVYIAWNGFVGATVWYKIQVPAVVTGGADSVAVMFWLTADFHSQTAIYFPDNWVYRCAGDGGPDPVLWPASSEHLTAMYINGLGGCLDPALGDWAVVTGDVPDTSVETQISNIGCLNGAPLYVGIGGADATGDGSSTEHGDFTLRWRFELSSTPGTLLTTDFPYA